MNRQRPEEITFVQVAPGTETVLAIGPGPSALIDEVTQGLDLL